MNAADTSAFRRNVRRNHRAAHPLSGIRSIAGNRSNEMANATRGGPSKL
jgi:hypothetical protein